MNFTVITTMAIQTAGKKTDHIRSVQREGMAEYELLAHRGSYLSQETGNSPPGAI